MSLDSMDRLRDYVSRSTIVYRKGEVVTETTQGAIAVITVDAFPALPKGAMSTVDCHFVHVGFTEALAELSHQEFYDLVISSREGMYANAEYDFWANGPSYIAIGAWIGDQTLAFQFMACVSAHGLGNVFTPASLGVDGEKAQAMAGAGYVLLTGLRDPSVELPIGEPS